MELKFKTPISPLAIVDTAATGSSMFPATEDHTHSGLAYALLAGRSGGQMLNFGTGAGEGGTLHSTAHATKGTINIADTLTVDEVNKRVGLGGSPTAPLHVFSIDPITSASIYSKGFIRCVAIASGYSGFEFADLAGNLRWQILKDPYDDFTFWEDGISARFRIFRGGNISIGGASKPTTGSFGLIFADGTALASMDANTAGLYAQTVSGVTHLIAIASDGTTVQLV